uniref:Uncharacterized protein n=1 Tax=Siphoviridae sp. ct7BG1 TaxID=2825349 RepID=A0A8S5U4J9_9CAUD|nr:MAG TPA: hypothetical protein [Siphoviridae sp. ct7BG1]DAZ03562.1 MAG TPA: hypothetical protein [Caudoviricetes sp.]DAZ44661.1 MAG TPA: hypothetical protein [Caudoviricetes sp.]
MGLKGREQTKFHYLAYLRSLVFDFHRYPLKY